MHLCTKDKKINFHKFYNYIKIRPPLLHVACYFTIYCIQREISTQKCAGKKENKKGEKKSRSDYCHRGMSEMRRDEARRREVRAHRSIDREVDG